MKDRRIFYNFYLPKVQEDSLAFHFRRRPLEGFAEIRWFGANVSSPKSRSPIHPRPLCEESVIVEIQIAANDSCRRTLICENKLSTHSVALNLSTCPRNNVANLAFDGPRAKPVPSCVGSSAVCLVLDYSAIHWIIRLTSSLLTRSRVLCAGPLVSMGQGAKPVPPGALRDHLRLEQEGRDKCGW